MEPLAETGSGRQGVLLIGTGRRIRENFMPAFEVLSDRFSVVGAHSRQHENRQRLTSDWGVRAFASLDEVPWEAVDVTVVSTPPASVPDVLTRLVSLKAQMRLILDTPAPLIGKGDPLHAALRKFSNVYVAEDFRAFPQFSLMRQVVRSGVIGDVTSVRLDRWGYEYHGLALVRSFFNVGRISAARRTRARIDILVSHGRRGEISLPYDPSRGGVTVTGTGGSVTTGPSVPGAAAVCASGPEDQPSGFVVEAGGRRFRVELAHTAVLCADRRFPSDWFNICKTHGLISVLAAAAEGRPASYSLADAVYDARISRIVRRMFYVDPRALRGRRDL